MTNDGFYDLYEILQISANAEPETVQRCYRMLAHRYHPDNQETGSDEKFKMVREAYRILSDPTERARYDVDYHGRKSSRWKVFDTEIAAGGVEAEKGIRQALLSALYARRRAEPHDPGISLLEMEEVLGLPREHMEFAIWFLKDKKLVLRTDDARLIITADGVEHIEESGLGARLQKMIEHKIGRQPAAAAR